MDYKHEHRVYKEIPQVNPELKAELDKLHDAADGTTQGFDKNTPSSLKQLRWAIYDVVDRCHARTSSTELNQKIEELFKEYTNS